MGALTQRDSLRFARLHNSVFSNQRQPLSPIWESFIFAVAQPLCQINLRASKESSGQPDATKRITLLQKIADFHPFNFSDSEVNTSRGKLVFSVLEQILARHPRSLTWWPSDAESFVEAVKKEREEVGTYGYVGGAKQDERAESSAEDKKSRDSWSSTKVERKISDSASLANG